MLLVGTPTQVVFRVSHAVMDGKGVHLWATDVFRVLRGEQPLGAPDTIADHELIDRIGPPGKATRLSPRYRSPVGHGPLGRGDRRSAMRHRSVTGTTHATVARIAARIAEMAGWPIPR